MDVESPSIENVDTEIGNHDAAPATLGGAGDNRKLHPEAIVYPAGRRRFHR